MPRIKYSETYYDQSENSPFYVSAIAYDWIADTLGRGTELTALRLSRLGSTLNAFPSPTNSVFVSPLMNCDVYVRAIRAYV